MKTIQLQLVCIRLAIMNDFVSRTYAYRTPVATLYAPFFPFLPPMRATELTRFGNNLLSEWSQTKKKIEDVLHETLSTIPFDRC